MSPLYNKRNSSSFLLILNSCPNWETRRWSRMIWRFIWIESRQESLLPWDSITRDNPQAFIRMYVLCMCVFMRRNSWFQQSYSQRISKLIWTSWNTSWPPQTLRARILHCSCQTTWINMSKIVMDMYHLMHTRRQWALETLRIISTTCIMVMITYASTVGFYDVVQVHYIRQGGGLAAQLFIHLKPAL